MLLHECSVLGSLALLVLMEFRILLPRLHVLTLMIGLTTMYTSGTPCVLFHCR